VTENQPYLQNGKAYKLQTWYTDAVPASPTCVVTSNLEAHGCSSHHFQGRGKILKLLPYSATEIQLLLLLCSTGHTTGPAACFTIKNTPLVKICNDQTEKEIGKNINIYNENPC